MRALTRLATATFAHLSDESMSTIFIMVQTTATAPRMCLSVLLSVCRRWRQVVFGCPAIWTYLDTEFVLHPQFFRYAQIHSRDASLVVDYIVDNPFRVVGLRRISCIKGRLASLTIGITSVEFRRSACDVSELASLQAYMNALLRGELPRLLTLRISWYAGQLRPIFRPARFIAPRLISLALENVYLVSGDASYSLEGYRATMDVPLSDYDVDVQLKSFFDLLVTFPALETIILDNAIPTSTNVFISCAMRSLEFLHTLYIRDCAYQLHAFVNSIVAPNIRHVSAWLCLPRDGSISETQAAVIAVTNAPLVRSALSNRLYLGAYISVSFKLDNFATFAVVHSSADAPVLELRVRPESLLEESLRRCKGDQCLLRTGGSRFQLCAYSPGDFSSLSRRSANPNIYQAEMAMRARVIEATRSSFVKQLFIRGATHALGEYTILCPQTAKITVDGAGEVMPSWVWMGRPAGDVVIRNCYFTHETKRDVDDFEKETGTKLAFVSDKPHYHI